MKEQILALAKQGLSYNEIQRQLGCSKGTISFHLGEGQKEKTRDRQRKRRTSSPLALKLDRYKARKGFRNKVHHFNLRQRGGYTKGHGNCSTNFNPADVREKFGDNPTCYLTGEAIDLSKPNTYHFDHIVPVCKGGDNSLDNLGLTLKQANEAKNGMMLDEFLDFCEKILRHHKRI